MTEKKKLKKYMKGFIEINHEIMVSGLAENYILEMPVIIPSISFSPDKNSHY